MRRVGRGRVGQKGKKHVCGHIDVCLLLLFFRFFFYRQPGARFAGSTETWHEIARI